MMHIKSINLKLQLIDLLIEERNKGTCPFGEWPSVTLLREMRDDYLSIKEKQNG